jgi:hypothetical protein
MSDRCEPMAARGMPSIEAALFIAARRTPKKVDAEDSPPPQRENRRYVQA